MLQWIFSLPRVQPDFISEANTQKKIPTALNYLANVLFYFMLQKIMPARENWAEMMKFLFGIKKLLFFPFPLCIFCVNKLFWAVQLPKRNLFIRRIAVPLQGLCWTNLLHVFEPDLLHATWTGNDYLNSYTSSGLLLYGTFIVNAGIIIGFDFLSRRYLYTGMSRVKSQSERKFLLY